MNLNEILKNKNKVQYVPKTGLLEGRFYHVVFAEDESGEYHPYVLFDNGEYCLITQEEIGDKKKKVSQFILNDKTYVISNNGPLNMTGGIVNTIDNNGIQDHMEGTVETKEAMYGELNMILDEYYDFNSEAERQIVIAQILNSYLLGFGATFYILLSSGRNTGKSSLQSLMAQLQFNGCFLAKTTVAALVRTIDHFGAAVNIDEFEKLDDTTKTGFTAVLNSGAYPLGTYQVMEKTKQGMFVATYKTYGPKTFSVNSSDFDQSLLSRCVIIHPIRNRRAVRSITTLSREDQEYFQSLRNKLFVFCLRYGREIQESIKYNEAVLQDENLFGRRADIFAINLSIIDYLTGDITNLKEYLLEKEELDNEDEEIDSHLYLTLEYILINSNFQEGEFVSFSNKNLKDHLLSKLDLDELDFNDRQQRSPTSSSIGLLLKRNKIIRSKKERRRIAGKGAINYEIPVERVIELVIRHGFKDLYLYIPKKYFTTSQDEGD